MSIENASTQTDASAVAQQAGSQPESNTNGGMGQAVDLSNTTFATLLGSVGVEDDEEEGEEEDEDDEEDEEDDDEAEAITRRLGDQLWADINKAKAQADRAAWQSGSVAASSSGVAALSFLPENAAKKQTAALATLRNILAFAGQYPAVHSALSTTLIPNMDNSSLFDVLHRASAQNFIDKGVASLLSPLLISLAITPTTFDVKPDTSIAASKRKHAEIDADSSLDDAGRFLRRSLYYPQTPADLRAQLLHAVGTVKSALSAPTSEGRILDSDFVSTIQVPLHSVFLFAVTLSARGGPDMKPLQELSGLIQVIGVLSGVPIAPTSSPVQASTANSASAADPLTTDPAAPWTRASAEGQSRDIGAAVYPCLVPACKKTFSRLYSLRAHQRQHASHRPFRCSICPASFARSHDLKRHEKLHDNKAWKCAGCNKVFSRRDAIKRHKKTSAARGAGNEKCEEAEILVVDVEKKDGEKVAGDARRNRMWEGPRPVQDTLETGVSFEEMPSDGLEDGQIPTTLLEELRSEVLTLQPLLTAHVTSNPTSTSPDVAALDEGASRETLASVIARAQQHALSAKDTVEQVAAPSAGATTEAGAAVPVMSVSTSPQVDTAAVSTTAALSSSLSLYGLSDEQTKMLEDAIASAALAAQVQAEAEAALEEENDEVEDDEDDEMSEGGEDVVPVALDGASGVQDSA
jgi:hypothetical protein